MLNNQNIKIRILAYGFIAPIIVLGSLMLLFNYTELRSVKFLSGISFIGTLLHTLFTRYFSQDKFLSETTIVDDKLELTYYNSLVEKDYLTIRNTTIKDVIIKKKKFLLRSLNTITIASKKNSITFFVFETELDGLERTINFFLAKQQEISSS